MRTIEITPDLNGHPMQRGDTVTTVCGGTTGKIKDIISDDGAHFVELRPLHRATGKGIWHAADRLLWLSAGRSTSKAAAPSRPASDPRQAGKQTVTDVAKSPKRKK